MHHGRDPVADRGLDCLGYVLCVYRRAGLSIDELDMPYGEKDQFRFSERRKLYRQLSKRFEPQTIRVPMDPVSGCRDGDLLVVGRGKDPRPSPPTFPNHVAIVYRDCALEMTARKLRIHRLNVVWPFIESVWRHKKLAR